MNPLNRLIRHNFSLPDAAVEKFNSARSELETRDNVIYFEGVIVTSAEYDMYDSYDLADGLISPKKFREALDAVEGDVEIRVNSPGGVINAAVPMISALSERAQKDKVSVVVDGIAASAATYLLFAENLDSRKITPLSEIMIHQSWACVCGNSDQLTKASQTLKKLDSTYIDYVAERTNMSAKEASDAVNAETYFTAEESVAAGFVDEIEDNSIPAKNQMSSFERLNMLVAEMDDPIRMGGRNGS